MTYTLIIPAYNEQDRLPPFLKSIREFAKETALINRVIVVNDASTDATLERAMHYMNNIPGFQIINLPSNLGKWGAITQGMLAASEDILVILDADGSVPIDVLRVIPPPSKGVILWGNRFDHESSLIGKSLLRRIVSFGYRQYVQFWYAYYGGRWSVRDMQCPFKVFWRSDVLLPIHTRRFAGDVEFAVRCRGMIVNVPVTFVHRAGSKITCRAVWNMLLETPKAARRGARAVKKEVV